MWPSVEYYCPCLSTSAIQTPAPPTLASSSANFHSLHNLYFCEECDAIRCDRCVSVEVSGYYCPNCLFEVPSASVRAEKNRCARNCFLCPICRATLSVVASDPPDDGSGLPRVPTNTVGEPPYFLYCNYCRWDSAEVGITFEKPTGLAAQLQKHEDSAPESLEFDRLKEHLEPFLRVSAHSPAAHLPVLSSHHLHTSTATAAASAALARDIPGVASRYNPLVRSRSGRDRTANKDEMPEYRSRVEVGFGVQLGTGGNDGATEHGDIELLRHTSTAGEVAQLEQRWGSSWITPLRTGTLRPLRIPLHSKVSKRCPVCRHILIKPEQKAQSVRYKIKLVAANYLPALTVGFESQTGKRPAGKGGGTDAKNAGTGVGTTGVGVIVAGTSGNAFRLALTNPLYDPIQVRLSPQRVAEGGSGFQVSLPLTPFAIGAFAEAWEYDDDEDMFVEDDELGLDVGKGGGTRSGDRRGRAKHTGILERRANVTVVGGEVNIHRAYRGQAKFNMLVSYTYRSDDPLPSEDGVGSTTSRVVAKTPEVKTFSFYTVVNLGPIVVRDDRGESEV